MFSFRYSELLNARNLLISTCGLLQKKKTVFLTKNFHDCYLVLKNSHIKGLFIEQFVACPAWSPVLSIESTDGDLWKQLQRRFKTTFTQLSWEEKIPKLIKKYIKKTLLKTKDINNTFIREIICQTMFEVLFHIEPTQEQIQLFCSASMEWSKEIAMRGSRNPQLKKEFWQELSLLVSFHYPEMKSMNTKERMIFISSLAQPFILSPMINFSDIYASFSFQIEKSPQWGSWLQKQVANNQSMNILHFMLECIRIHHPFPIFEREMIKDLSISDQTLKKGTQVFILLDSFSMEKDIHLKYWENQDKNIMKSFIFGSGARSCLGQKLAESILVEMTKNLVLENIPLTKLQSGLSFSGRLNDHQTIPGETLYQTKKAVNLLKSSYAVGKGEKVQCPFHTAQSDLQSF
ncbi:MAG: cytochrome P450 [Oligoflexales bacterium]